MHSREEICLEDIEVNLSLKLPVDANNDVTLLCPRCMEKMTVQSTNIKSLCLNKNIDRIECYLKEPKTCQQESCRESNPSKLNFVLVTFPIHKKDLYSPQLKPDESVKKSDSEVSESIGRMQEKPSIQPQPAGRP